MHYASVRVSRWVWLFLACAGIQAAQILLDRSWLPYAGTLATAALLGYAASRAASRPLALAGLAALTLAAGVVDGDEGGYGWPIEFGASSNPLAGVLVLLAAGLLGVAVLDQAGPGVRRRHLVPAALASLLVLVLFASAAATPVPGWDLAVPYSTALVAVLFLPVVALILVLFAANAALAAGRRWRAAGIGLFPVLILALGGLAGVGSLALLEPKPESSLEQCGPADGLIHSCSVLRLTTVEQLPADAALALARERAAAYAGEAPAMAMVINTAPDRAVSATSISWNWEEDPDWSTLLPATAAALLLLGLAAYVRSMFPL